MTPQEKVQARKLWQEKAKRRRRLLQEKLNGSSVPERRKPDKRTQAAQLKSSRARRRRNLMIKTQAADIIKLKSRVDCYKKRLQRLSTELTSKLSTEDSPNTKVNALVNSPTARDLEIVRKQLLYGEVLSRQLNENYSNLSSTKEKKIFKRVISGKLVNKYNVLDKEKTVKPLKNLTRNCKLIESRQKSRKYYGIMKKKIITFMEEYSNSRVCAGKKDCITKQGERKQKRIRLDTLFNLHKLFLEKSQVQISYSAFCKLQPFWIVEPHCSNRNTCMCVTHSNMDLCLSSLYNAKIISVPNHVSFLNSICCNRHDEKCLARKCEKCLARKCENCKHKGIDYKEFDNSNPLNYQKWQSVRQDYVDPKTKKTKTVTKCVKSTLKINPRDLILDLENNDNNELNIVHQYQALKAKKENLTDSDAIIHVDFSENFQTKYAEEVQSFHFGGSRQQISMHTVVVYTKRAGEDIKSKCFCTLSENLSHSPSAIWAHLQPILDSLPATVTNLHFLSDGPVTQYRNKIMFKVLATKLEEFYPNLMNFSWNYHESGHGKGAPDGVGATCKRTADKLVASGTDISSLEDFTQVLQKNCPNITVLIITDADIADKEAKFEPAKTIKTFTGTLKVHQICGSVFLPNRLIMKSLSCFCNPDNCDHFKLSILDFSQTKSKSRWCIDNVYSSACDTDYEPLSIRLTKKSTKKKHHSKPSSSRTLRSQKHTR
ncbi:unnamed protein product [Psylliodes chrysocephalus]|uniref:Uncharacterized protein n=1 Tax=Psylliodes chrysocephalus TaxID=3402493 RepID=A0A9P0G277_9CUCU|nr:unnamed protein product [Psylliodes chrysocephala]